MSARGAHRTSTLTDEALRQMTGLNRAQFAELLVEIAPAAEAARTQRQAGEREGAAYVRRRGAGRRPTFPLAGQLLIALIYLRWNIPYRMLAALFDSDKDTERVPVVGPVVMRVGVGGGWSSSG